MGDIVNVGQSGSYQSAFHSGYGSKKRGNGEGGLCAALDKNRILLNNIIEEFFVESLAQVDRIISEVNALEEKEKIIFLHKIGEIFDNSDEQQDEEVSIESVFGLWKDRDITKETLRKKAWMKN